MYRWLIFQKYWYCNIFPYNGPCKPMNGISSHFVYEVNGLTNNLLPENPGRQLQR